MDVETFKCPKCEYTHTKLNSLRIHCQKLHGISSMELRTAVFGRPTCACGCGELTEPNRKLENGFNRYVLGHIARVNNGWGHNKKALKKSQDKRREMWKRGEIKAWCAGKTKDDPDVARMIEKGRQTILNDPENVKGRSDRMRKNRLNGTIPTLRGKDHSQWKGGVSALQALCRSYVYNSWTRPKMKASEWKCSECGATGHLEVHHDKERFADILQKAIAALGEPGEDFEKKAAFAQWVSDYHVDHEVSGVVLCEGCHNATHASIRS